MATGTLNLPGVDNPYPILQGQAEKAPAVGYDPSAFTVDKNQTVAGQLTDLIDQNSPYMQQATRRANQAMNDRGLLNSSIAVGAGQDAAIQAALPIATTDAGTFNQAMTNTKNAENAGKYFGASAKNTAALQNAQLGTQVSMANAEQANKAQGDVFTAKLDQSTKLALQNLDNNNKIQLANIDGKYRQLLQSNQSAASMFNQVAGNIAQIAQSQTLDPTGKNNSIASQINLLNEALRTIQATSPGDASLITSLDLGGYFQGGGNTGGTGSTTGTGYGVGPDLLGTIPAGGWRDAQGNVYNADGSLAPWKGPVGQPTAVGGTNQSPSFYPGVGGPPPSGVPAGFSTAPGSIVPADQVQGDGGSADATTGIIISGGTSYPVTKQPNGNWTINPY